MIDLFLDVKYLAEVIRIIKDAYPLAEVWAYGSRAYGNEKTAHNGSDLDLCVKDFGCENGDVMWLRELFTESDLPFLVDIFEYDRLPLSFQKEINKKHLVIYKPKG